MWLQAEADALNQERQVGLTALAGYAVVCVWTAAGDELPTCERQLPRQVAVIMPLQLTLYVMLYLSCVWFIPRM